LFSPLLAGFVTATFQQEVFMCIAEFHFFSPSKAKHLAADVMPMTSMPGFEYLWEI
jgi:hypothetical protein